MLDFFDLNLLVQDYELKNPHQPASSSSHYKVLPIEAEVQARIERHRI